jgi:hypothetical protein
MTGVLQGTTPSGLYERQTSWRKELNSNSQVTSPTLSAEAIFRRRMQTPAKSPEEHESKRIEGSNPPRSSSQSAVSGDQGVALSAQGTKAERATGAATPIGTARS